MQLINFFGTIIGFKSCWDAFSFKRSVYYPILTEKSILLRLNWFDQGFCEIFEQHGKVQSGQIFIFASLKLSQIFSQRILEMRQHNLCLFAFQLFSILAQILINN